MDYIQIENAYVNNLKNISIKIPKNKFIVITGISGSGKSSLAFDLIFEEGRKKYLQSIGMALDFGTDYYTNITGLSPTVAVKQNLIRQSNPRSTVGSKTGLLNKFSLLFANEGSYQDSESFSLASDDINPDIFSYLSPNGMCFDCAGTGKQFRIHMENIISAKTMTVEQVFQQIGSTKGYLNLLQRKYTAYFHEPFSNCPIEIQNELIYGVVDNYSGKTSYCVERVLHNRYLRNEDVQRFYSLEICESCNGYRICDEARMMKIANLHLGEIASMSLIKVKEFLDNYIEMNKLSGFGMELSRSLIATLNSLINIKLGHLTMYREIPTLSGGELQRIFLYDHLESKLDSLIYVFDEPTSGLHESEKQEIIESLQSIKAHGNTVLIVSHDKKIIKTADYIIDIGTKAGDLGGEIVYQGSYSAFLNNHHSLTSKFLDYDMTKSFQKNKQKTNETLSLSNANQNNLKNISVDIPLNRLVGIAGVSGSGKSTLISKTLVPLCKEQLKNSDFSNPNIKGMDKIQKIIEISQAPIGRKANSNPVTYIGLWDKIRELFAKQPQAVKEGLKAGDFSFNSNGACPSCKGSGVEDISIGYDIQFSKTCPECNGTRFNSKTLQVLYKQKNINDVLEMSVDEALSFFEGSTIDLSVLNILKKIGMDYVKLGQPTSTLSGGEAQRIKLAKEIGKTRKKDTLYVLDEPSAGLSQYDISKLLYLLNELVTSSNSVIVIEHDLDILKCCDWIIELGQGSGDKGGEVIAEGNPTDLSENNVSITGRYL
ncbi:excinuclease ABC subunit UvrA [Listeria monocytogenes]|uniref:excinuclease ABC subunit UvrA n=1 Tax=Listeria monocytogenes TaxID=1639 RepID=UPI0010B2111B|nr:excinuclease ABC subunit UvrA [Listeria monocytogenes]EAC8327160.1 excinuclease ABC subunit UvrA [Listeria monocytogenes]EAC8327265.1 excinuclease ABC subunit UvrA [Listeria monocytogenes]EAC8330012.1 excinuclease ABC subunit UvrA [Listeria monocytogenes]EAC8330193.1 excinuclease ABC subunit UvrA [Listeria monocytogenes]EAC8637226.1 excinuclease ABC subunit UvrA [Listeria monocytogenes]